MSKHITGTRDEWLAARLELLEAAGCEPWRLDFRTRIQAPLYHGVPQPRPGQQARVESVLCGQTRRVARSIVVTG